MTLFPVRSFTDSTRQWDRAKEVDLMFTLRFTLWSVGLPVTFPNKKFWLKFPNDRFSITVGQDTGAEEGLVERRTYPPCNSSPVD